MHDAHTTLGGPGRGFPQTRWSSILAAREGEERARHLESLIRQYWKPVYLHIRHSWNKTNEEAKDLTQEFFLRVLGWDFPGQVDPSHGRFRSYLKACLQHFLLDDRKHRQAAKRGGGARILSLEAEPLPIAAPGVPAEELLDREWARGLLEGALADLEAALTAAGRERAWRVFQRLDVEAPRGERPRYADLAQELGVPAQTVKSDLDHARRALRKLVLERIRDYCEDEEQAAREIADLFPR